MTEPISASDIQALRTHGNAFNGEDNADKYWKGLMLRTADALDLLVEYRDMLAAQGTQPWEAQLISYDLTQIVEREGDLVPVIPRIDLRKGDGTYKTMDEIRTEAKAINEAGS